MFSQFKDKGREKAEEMLEQQIPRIKQLLEDKIGIKLTDAIENDELMASALGRAYDLLVLTQPVTRFLIKRENFVDFFLKNRDRLLTQAQ